MFRIVHLPRVSRRSLLSTAMARGCCPEAAVPYFVQGLGRGTELYKGGLPSTTKRQSRRCFLRFAGGETISKKVCEFLRAPRADHLGLLPSSVTQRLVTQTRGHRQSFTCGLRFRRFLRSDGRWMKGDKTRRSLILVAVGLSFRMPVSVGLACAHWLRLSSIKPPTR